MRTSRNRTIVYPPKCREISEDLSTDDLIRRLKDISMAFQDLSQEEDNSQYIPLALLLSTDFYLEHPSRDVRLLVACSIADVFRVYAPNAPYESEDLIKKIFRFFIQQLKGLEDPKHPTFKRYFYLLENLAWVKSFNICIELEDSQVIFCELFTLIFSIVNENHSDKVKNFMVDMLTPLISESDNTSPELLEIVLTHLIEPKKTHVKHACALSQEIIRRTMKTLGFYIIKYLDTAIASESNPVSEDPNSPINNSENNGQTANYFRKNISGICDLIYELNKVCPSVLQDFLPQLEYKIKSNEERERCEFTKLLARLFSDKESSLSETYPELWKSFLGRFKDISATVRIKCVQYSMHFLINHPEMKGDVTAQLKHRYLDPDDNVRHEVVMAIASTAKKGMDYINEELIEIIVNRTQDAKFKIRRESLYALAQLYKQYVLNIKPEGLIPVKEAGINAVKMLHCIKNRCLENYYRPSLEDKLVVEKILSACLVPVSLPLEERMRVLYVFFATISDVAAKAFSAIQRQQQLVREQVLDILEILKEPSGAAKDAALKQKVQACSRSLLEPVKTEEYIMKFIDNIKEKKSLLDHFELVVCSTTRSPYDEDGNFQTPPSSKAVEQSAREVLRSLGNPVQTNSFYMIIKNLMERVAPIMIDHDGILMLFQNVADSLIGDGELDSKMGIANSSKRGLELILSFANVFPNLFYGKDPYNGFLLPFLWHGHSNHHIPELVLQILAAIGSRPFFIPSENSRRKSDAWWSDSDNIQRIIKSCILNASSPKQAKFAIRCINSVITDENEKDKIYGQILDSIKDAGLTLESSHFRSHLAALGMIATCGGQNKYPAVLKSIIHKFVVQGLIMKDTRSDIEIQAQERSEASLKQEDRISFDRCSEEVKCKVEGLKLLVHWIHGMKMNWLTMQDKEDLHSKYVKTAQNALQLCKTIVQNSGDLNEKDAAGTTTEKAHLKLTAAISMLKIIANDSTVLSKPTKNSLGGDAAESRSETQPTFCKAPAPVSQLLTPQQLHIVATTLIDKQEFVSRTFAAKLHRKLYNLELGLEFLAIFALGGTFTPDTKPDSFYVKLKNYLDLNLSKRREFIKTNSAYQSIMYPDCCMPFVIHLLAHMSFYTKYDDVEQLEIVKNCLWFIMEPFVFKNENYSFTFFKKTFECIKICIDKVTAPEDDGASSTAANLINFKIYCACDLALGLVMSKTQNFASKESPVRPQLHSKYYKQSKRATENNFKNYLPESMQFPPPKRCGLENEMLGKANKKVKRN